LTRQLFYRTLFDLTRDAKISCTEYLDIVVKFLDKETDEEILNITVRNISGLITYYLPQRCYAHYADEMFKLVETILANNISNKEIVLTMLEVIILFAHSEEHMQLLKEWLIHGPYVRGKENSKVEIPPQLLIQDHRFNIVTLLHRSKNIASDEKVILLEAEVTRDNNSDRSIRARCRCKAALPNPDIKAELWNKFVNEPNSDSLYNMKAYMSTFASVDQLDIVENFLKAKFFDDALTVGKQEFFYVDAFVMYCGPVYFVNEDVIDRLEKLAENASQYDTLKRRLLELADDMRRYLKAQSLAEVYLSILNKWK
jgi:aminopeptidase N